MAKVKITGHASGSGVITVTAPNTSTDRTITLPDSTDTLIGSATTDVLTTRVNGASGRKNMFINGAMNVAQRATSVTGVIGGTYDTLDRYTTFLSNLGTYTVSKDTDSPEEFSSSWKIACTTAVTSIASGSYLTLGQKFEGQDLQHLKYGTSNAQSVTLSFWVKSSKTGTYMCELFQDDGSGKNSITYTVNSANTWEKKELTFVGNTGTAIANDVTSGLRVYWVLAAGSDRTSGTHSNNTWHTTSANRYPGIVNFADSTSNTFYVTGAQLEVGSVATDFEHRSYGEELALCQRYYSRSTTLSGLTGAAVFHAYSTTESWGGLQFPVTMRTTPTITVYNNAGTSGGIHRIGGPDLTGVTVGQISATGFAQVYKNGALLADDIYACTYTASAEL